MLEPLPFDEPEEIDEDVLVEEEVDLTGNVVEEDVVVEQVSAKPIVLDETDDSFQEKELLPQNEVLEEKVEEKVEEKKKTIKVKKEKRSPLKDVDDEQNDQMSLF